MHEIYVGYKINDDGMEGLSQHLMKDVWFTDPFIADRKDFESIDPFGNPIAFPPLFPDFMSMFGTTTTYKMAEHEQKFKEFYDLYKNEEGYYDAKELPLPKRYLYNNAGGAIIGDIVDDGVTVDKDLKRKISDEAYKINGDMLRAIVVGKKLPYEKRKTLLPRIYDTAKDLAKLKYLPKEDVNEEGMTFDERYEMKVEALKSYVD